MPRTQSPPPSDIDTLVRALTDTFRTISALSDSLPKFDPASKEATSWLILFNQVYPSDTERLRKLPAALDGTACNWYATQLRLLNETTRIWPEWEQAFLAEFGKSQMAVFHELSNRRQRIGEDAKNYYNDVINLCSLANSRMSESEKVNYLLRGLLPELQKQMVLMCPTDSDILSKLQVLLSHSSTTTEAINVDSVASAIVEKVKLRSRSPTASTEPILFGDSIHRRDSLQRSIDRLIADVRSLKQSNRRSVVCFNCGQAGHYARYCQRRRRNSNNGIRANDSVQNRPAFRRLQWHRSPNYTSTPRRSSSPSPRRQHSEN